MESNGEFEFAARAWFEASGAGFAALKEEFGVPDSWTFSLATPDEAASDTPTGSLEDAQGSAAFMLRRIQAVRFLVNQNGWDFKFTYLALGYLSSLGTYLTALLEDPERLFKEANRSRLRELRRVNQLFLAAVSKRYYRLRNTN